MNTKEKQKFYVQSVENIIQENIEKNTYKTNKYGVRILFPSDLKAGELISELESLDYTSRLDKVGGNKYMTIYKHI